MTEEELRINAGSVANYISRHPGTTAQEIADKLSSTPNDIDDVNEVLEYLFDQDRLVKFFDGNGPAKYSLFDYGKKVTLTTERVNHPSHYQGVPGVECIDVVEHFDFLIGNVVKYAWRAGSKDGVSKLEDLRKMAWYAQRAVEKEERESQRVK